MSRRVQLDVQVTIIQRERRMYRINEEDFQRFADLSEPTSYSDVLQKYLDSVEVEPTTRRKIGGEVVNVENGIVTTQESSVYGPSEVKSLDHQMQLF